VRAARAQRSWPPDAGLIRTYEVALDELRSWHDLAVAGLVTALETLHRQAIQERRYRDLSRRAAKRLDSGV
jgi:hypothetical protein